MQSNRKSIDRSTWSLSYFLKHVTTLDKKKDGDSSAVKKFLNYQGGNKELFLNTSLSRCA